MMLKWIVCLFPFFTFGLVSAKEFKAKMISENPRIYWIDDFLTHKECDDIIKLSTPHLKPSTVVSLESGGDELHPARTSYGMFFPTRSTTPTIQKIEKRIAAYTKLPLENGEGMQVLKYGIGGEYRPHFDYFDSATTGGNVHISRGGQRVATLIMYLNNTEEGGETIFPKLNISVKPVKGGALLFYNCTPDGKEDPQTLHGGAPVKKGEKWIATKWIRFNRFN